MLCKLNTYCPDKGNGKDGRIRIGSYIVTDQILTGTTLVLGKWETRSPLMLVNTCFVIVAVLYHGATKHSDTGHKDTSPPSSLSPPKSNCRYLSCHALPSIRSSLLTKICTLKKQPSAWRLISLFIHKNKSLFKKKNSKYLVLNFCKVVND